MRSRDDMILGRHQPRFQVIHAIIGALASLAFATVDARADTPGSIEFFENRIRPVLVQHCYECHSSDAEEIGGGLALDHRDGMMTGGDSGPAIKPGDLEASVLISAIRYESSEMPPEGRLSENVIRDFESWIMAGAVDPRAGVAERPLVSGVDLEAGRTFWAFQPLKSSMPSPSATAVSGRGAIDAYLHERLAGEGLTPNGIANPATQLRRLSFDLTGLPPSPAMQERWLANPSVIHWRRLTNELMATREFAEHWARHWMDVARYADSNGSDFNATFHEAWRYREYLIESFAEDRPFDQMIREQIAGDLLPSETDQQRHDNVVATTFLMLGTKMLSERDKPKLVMDVVDEQIDTVGRAFLGLTLGCARCHDHKFDPVPTEDYYALAGILKSTVTLKGESQKYVSTWNRVALPASDAHQNEVAQHAAEVKSLTSRIEQSQSDLKNLQDSRLASLAGIVIDDQQAVKTGNWKGSVVFKDFVGEGYVHDNNADKGEASIQFLTQLPKAGRYEIRIAHSPGSNRASAVPITITTVDGDVTVHADQRKTIIEPMWLSLGEFQLPADREVSVTISNDGTSGYVIADAVQLLREGDQPVADDARASEVKQAKLRIKELQAQKSELEKSAPRPLPTAMAPSDRATDGIADSPVHIRGEVRNLGPVVRRGFLQVCSSGDASIRAPHGSGRIALADWLTDPDNPLVARVFVNRVWMHLTGEGLVRTVDNFGIQGERPTHPELLDHLTIEFVRDGWRLKPLIRAIVSSDAYRRSSEFSEHSYAADPENRLLWRMHRRRLPAESIRDSMVVASGVYDPRPRLEPMAGRGVLVSSNNGDSTARFDDISQPCRSIYLPVVRGYVPALMASLDAADPDLLVGRRPTTNVPGQALVLINSPIVDAWARATGERVTKNASSFRARLRLVFAMCLQRMPNESDLLIARDFFRDRESSQEAWNQYIAATFAGTEFRLLD